MKNIEIQRVRIKASAVFLITLIVEFSITAQIVSYDKMGNRTVHDHLGNLLEYHLLDEDGKVRGGEEIAKRIYKYDSSGNLTLEAYYKSNDSLYEYPNTVAMKRYFWDTRNLSMTEHYYNGRKKSTIDLESGASIIWWKFDSLRRKIESRYFDVDSVPCQNNLGSALVKYSDDNGFPRQEHFNLQNDLFRIIDRDSHYLSSLMLYSSSIPKWARKAQQFNLVDGVMFRSLTYALRFKTNESYGKVEFFVEVDNVLKVRTVTFKESTIGDPDIIKKCKRALNKARFISLGNSSDRSFVGVVQFLFQSTVPLPSILK